MKIIITIIVVSIAIKDFIFINDVYLLRGISQGLSMAFGLLLLINNIKLTIVKKYYILFLYILTITISGILSNHIEYVLMQILSLVSILVFSIAICEHNENNIQILNNIVLVVLSVTVLASLILGVIAPNLAFSAFYEGDSVGNRYRFHGIYPKSAMISTSAGILLGLACFKVKSRSIKIVIIACCITCLYLTGARTFWVASIFAVIVTTLIYNRKWIIYSILPLTLSIVFLVCYYISSESDNMLGIANSAIRSDSLNNLSGRTVLWKKSIDGFKNRPLLGYGFTTGAESLIDSKKIKIFSSKKYESRIYGRSTLHNGYLQAALDSGLIGLLLYISIIITSIVRLIKYDIDKKYSVIFYIIIFYAISNLGESVIGSTASFGGFFIWVSLIIALSLYKPIKEMPQCHTNSLSC